MKLTVILIAAGLALVSQAAVASPLSVSLDSMPANSTSPQMGDRLTFETVIHNNGTIPLKGLIAWISLVQVDAGREQPVDLEDWSAHKAVVAAILGPGGVIKTNWPMRLIQAGHYRVVVSAATRNGRELATSRIADFVVRQKTVVETQRVLVVALGIPFIVGGFMFWRWRATNSMKSTASDRTEASG